MKLGPIIILSSKRRKALLRGDSSISKIGIWCEQSVNHKRNL